MIGGKSTSRNKRNCKKFLSGNEGLTNQEISEIYDITLIINQLPGMQGDIKYQALYNLLVLVSIKQLQGFDFRKLERERFWFDTHGKRFDISMLKGILNKFDGDMHSWFPDASYIFVPENKSARSQQNPAWG